MHGWKSQPETIVVNMQSKPYDLTDEYRFPWDCLLGDLWEPRNGLAINLAVLGIVA